MLRASQDRPRYADQPTTIRRAASFASFEKRGETMNVRTLLASSATLGILWFVPCASLLGQSRTVVIRGVTVVDVTDGSLHPQRSVLVEGNRIVAVGAVREVGVPAKAEILEAAGRYLIPGLWDMHVHSVGPVAANTANPSIASQDWHLPLFLAYGVTGVRNMNDGTGDVTLELTNTIKRQLAE